MDELKDIILYGRKLVDRNLTSGKGGNLSIYDRDKGIIWISPSGMDYYEIGEDDLVAIDLDGNIVHGNRKPSSEWQLHSEIYKEREDVNAVIHGHTEYSTVMAMLRKPLPPSNYMIAMAGKEVRCADYETFGTLDLARSCVRSLGSNYAVLLSNHGLVTCGKDLDYAFSCLEQVEYVSKLHIIASSVGRPYIIGDEEMDRIMEKFKTYGQR